MKLVSNDGNQRVDFSIPDKYKKIAVNCSGGADSSLVLFLLIQYLRREGRENSTTIDILTCVNDKKGRWNARIATAVVDKIIDITGTTSIKTHYSYYRDIQDELYFHEFENKLFADNRINLIISGLTANPLGTHSIIVNKEDGTPADLRTDALPARDIANVDNTFWYLGTENNDFYMPIKRVDKQWVASQYEQFGIRKNLFPITRSCESIDPYNTNNFTEPCGHCWWCLERKWAFGEY